MIRRFEAMTCFGESLQGEDPILGRRGVNGSLSSGCRVRVADQGGSSLAKRPRHPPPPTPSANKENQEPPSPSPLKQQRSDDYNSNSSCQDDAGSEQQLKAVEEPWEQEQEEPSEVDMGSNLSRHHGHAKSLNGRRAHSSGNICDGRTINVGKFIVPCSKTSRESRYKFCGSLPNHLDGKDVCSSLDNGNDDDPRSENNNVITDTICGNLGGTLPHKRSSGHRHAHANSEILYADDSPIIPSTKHHRSDESLDGDPWKYRQEGADLARCRYIESLRRSRGSDAGCPHQHQHHQHQHGHQHEWRRNSSTLSRGSRCHRSAELEVASTSTLPKRRQDSTKRSAPSLGELGDGPTRASRISIDKIDDDLLLKMVRHSSCKAKPNTGDQAPQSNGKGPPSNHHHHRQPGSGKCVDLKLYKLSASGEPLDQGYASERSPEDEHPPSLPGQPFPNIKPESTFRVTLTKSSRGLGLSVSGGGTAGPVRVKRLFPQQPAALSNKLQPGDILLAANDVPLTGLTNYEALEVLRTTSATVELVVCRLPGGDATASPPGTAPPPPPTRKKDNKPGLTLKIPLNPLPPLDVEPCREFDIEMTKVGGSLGFTLRKADSSALGHYVRALVREPALSDGRIQPGDKIIAVDGADLSPLSHEEAVALLRKCGPKVKLRLYRDIAQTPPSALSPTEPDYPLRPPKTSLRQEAVDMLCDLAVRKLSPGASGSGSSCPRQSSSGSRESPRRLRRPATRSSTADTDEGSRNNRNSRASTLSQETSDSDQCSIKTQITNSQPETPGMANDIIDPPSLYDVCDSSDSSLQLPLPPPPPTSQPPANYLHRPNYLHLDRPYQANGALDSDCSDSYAGPIIVTDSDTSNFDYSSARAGLSSDEHDGAVGHLSNEPASMPPILSSASSTSTAFSYRNPAYQSANPAIYGLHGAPGGSQTTQTLLVAEPIGAKIKIAHSSEQDIPGKVKGADDPGGSKGLLKWKGVMFAPSDSDEDSGKCKIQVDKDSLESAAIKDLNEQGYEVFMVELTRGWNSRLGFSLQQNGEDTIISVVHPDTAAAKDGRLKEGDIVIMVNDESVEHMTTAKIIDLLRKIRGSIGITVLRRKKDSDAT